MTYFAFSNKTIYSFLQQIGFFAQRLIPKIFALNSIDDNNFYNDLISGVKLSNNIYKTTKPLRFKDLDIEWQNYLNKNEEYKFHDIAVSTGVTSYELYNELTESGYKIKLCISDKFATWYYKGRFMQTIFDSDYKVFCYYFFVFFVHKDNLTNPLLNRFYNYMTKTQTKTNKNLKQFKLFDHKLFNLIHSKNAIEIDFDVLTTIIESKFDCIRAMNILNKLYFDEHQLKKAIENIRYSLKENGIFLVGRTHNDGTNHASFFRKTGSQFVLLEDIGRGTEIKDIVIQ